jgi:hypothetical protein
VPRDGSRLERVGDRASLEQRQSSGGTTVDLADERGTGERPLAVQLRELAKAALVVCSRLADDVAQAVERRRDAEALRAKEARHRAMLEAALDCIVTMDHRGGWSIKPRR